MARKKGLDPKQQRFAEEYLLDLNATQAAIRAGYSPLTAKEQASRLLTNVNLQAEIDRLMAERSERTQVTSDQIVRELSRIAFADMRSLVEWGPDKIEVKDSADLAAKDSACVQEVTKRQSRAGLTISVKLHSKTEALKLLGQHLNMFRDRDETPGKTRVVIAVLGPGQSIEDLEA
jgi:phage terminase small subunit